MKRNEAMPGSYLKQEDFDPPVLCQVANVVVEEMNRPDGDGKDHKPVLYIMGPSRDLDVTRGIVLNGTNWDALMEITGKDDSDDWRGQQIVVYRDPDVRFGNKKVGGIRIRAPKPSAAPPVQTPAADEPPPISDEDLPF